MKLLNTRVYNTGRSDELQIITSTKFDMAIKYGNIPESIYGIAGIPIDPFQSYHKAKIKWPNEIKSCEGADGKTYLY